MTRLANRTLSLILAAIVGLAACTSAATPAPTQAPTAAPSSAGTTGPTASPLPGTKRFAVVFTSPGISSMAIMEAIADLKAQGYTIDTPTIAQANLAVEGAINGQFQISHGSTLSYLLATQKAATIRVIGSRNENENTLTVTTAIQRCADFAGKVWAHGGESSSSTFMGRNWVNQNCAGTKANEIIQAGSDLRAAAMLSGQVDASELEVADAITLTSGANASKFHVLVNFSTELPNLKTSLMAANLDWLAKNPGDTVAFLKAVIAQNRKINADPSGGYLKTLVLKYIPNMFKPDVIDLVTKAYAERKIFPATGGGVTTADLEYTIKWFTDAGVLPAGLTTGQAADLTLLNVALQQLG